MNTINLFDTINYQGNFPNYSTYRKVSWQLKEDGRPKLCKQFLYDSYEDSFRIIDKTYYFYNQKPVSFNENTIGKLLVFPNPVNGVLTIKTLSKENIYIFDANGKIIWSSYGSLSYQVELPRKGLYFVKSGNQFEKIVSF